MRKCALLALLLLTACASGIDYHTYLARKGVTQTAPEKFDHCHGYGCRLITEVIFIEKEWQAVEIPFTTSKTAADERARIAKAIGLMERMAGDKAGTGTDVAGTYVKLGDDQLDCVDESVNTTIYLSALKHRGAIRFHDINTPQARIFLTSGRPGPHQSAVITDTETGTRYAVDSWFHDNGHPAEIVPMQDWIFGWRPDKTKISAIPKVPLPPRKPQVPS